MKRATKEFKSFTVRVEKKYYLKLLKWAERDQRSLNFICSQSLIKMLKMKEDY